MTRDQALTMAFAALEPATADDPLRVATRAGGIVAVLEALDLVKFEEPRPAVHHVPALSYAVKGVNVSAQVREDTMIEALRKAGFEVYKGGQQSGSNLSNQVGQMTGLGTFCQGKP